MIDRSLATPHCGLVTRRWSFSANAGAVPHGVGAIDVRS
jgi:hypothetical protein